jgi:hypothetical protein
MKIIAQAYPNSELRIVICRDSSMKAPPTESVGGASVCPEECAPPLDITSELKTTTGGDCAPQGNQKAVRPGYGGHPRSTRFGANARRTLLRAGGTLEELTASPRQTIFLTGTLPGSTCDAMNALRDWSSYAVNLLKAKLSKLGTSDTYSLYVWELQKRGALHLHYAMVVEEPKLRGRVLRAFPRIWSQVIDAIARLSRVDMWAREKGGTWADQKEVLKADAQECRKSPGRYLAKYCSKEAGAVRYGVGKKGEFIGPVRWWGVSRPLLRELKNRTLKITSIGVPWRNIAQIKESILSILDGMNAKIQRYTDKAKSAEVFVGYDKENYMEVFHAIAGLLRVAPRNDRGDLCDAPLGSRRGYNHASAEQIAMESPGVAIGDEATAQHEKGGSGHDGVRSSDSGERPVSLCQMDIWGQFCDIVPSA